VGTSATLNTAVLPAGEHTLSLVVRDASGFRPGISVAVSVGGADCDASCTPDAEDIAAGRLVDSRPAPNGIADLCENQDGDGALDFEDPAPCDPTIEATSYAPARDQVAMAMYEDMWPGFTDLDFNDVVVSWNATALRDLPGNVRRLRLVMYVLALGGHFDNGLAVQLPVAASRVTGLTRVIGSGPSQTLALRADGQATFWVSANLRELFAFQTGPVNSVPGPRVAPVQVIVDVELSPGTALPIGGAPWDLFVFRAGEPGRQIHFPAFGGTSEMNGAFFGQDRDGSAPGRWFVDTDGLPYALAVPALAPYPLEGAPVSSLFPDIVGFAASGGTSNLGWYQSRVELAFAFAGDGWRPQVPAVLPTLTVDRSCLPAN
jgi:LruC domain-containing protein